MNAHMLKDQGKLVVQPMGGQLNPSGFGVLRHPPMESRTPNPNPRAKNPRSYRCSGFGEFDDNPNPNPNPSSYLLHEILDYIEGNRVSRFIKARSRDVQG